MEPLNTRDGVAVQAERSQAGGVRSEFRQLAHGCDPRADARQARAVRSRITGLVFLNVALLLAEEATHLVMFTVKAGSAATAAR